MGNNASRRSKRSDQKILEKIEKMNKGPYASPCPPTKSNVNTKQSLKHEKRGRTAANAALTGTNPKKTKEATHQPQKTSKRKKNKLTSAEPRKGRKEGYRLYVPIDDALCGLYDAAEHEGHNDGAPLVPLDTGVADPKGVFRDGKSSYEPIEEGLSGLYDAFDPNGGCFDGKSYLSIDDTFAGLYDAAGCEDPQDGLYDGKSYVPIDDTLSALCNVVDDEAPHNSSMPQPQQNANAATSPTKEPANPSRHSNPTNIYLQTFPTNTRGSSHTPTIQAGTIYGGTYDNQNYYDDGCGDSGCG
ncbi:uncharacterized protein KRP23_6810 [Phytophthora ramorum]|uniref:uncharacterized protein n=1 Tax=Phytophthora ramorum TaxID=164328 RepID=UPI0030B5B36B|nr:hypothetical protein KRP23_6810 [Phytophthora ramorum]